MLKCRKMRGLIAASIYEDLLEEDQKLLSTHLETCPGCKAQAEKLQRLSGAIPVTQPLFQGDLLPAIRFQLHHDRVWPTRQFDWRLGFLGALCLALVGLFAYQVHGHAGVYPHTETALLGAAPVTDQGPVRAEIEKASVLTRRHDYVTAYKTLKEATQQHPDDPFLSLAQLQLADLAYTHLKWYPEAYDAYEALVKLDPKLYSETSEVIARRNLLAEARQSDFAPLHALDAAHRSLEQFAQLEKVVAKYPGGLVAAMAAEDMARMAAEGLADDEHRHVLAMERARDRCNDAVAVARLNIELGHLYFKELNNPAKAREAYAIAAKSPNASLAQLAASSLAGIDATAR